MAFVPVHPPEAVHEVALLEDQVRVELPPEVMLVGLAAKLTVGAALVAATVTKALAGEDVPLAPLQVSVYVVVLAGDIETVPLVGFVPVHPPEAVHEVALLEDQVRVELPPKVMLVAPADKLTVGVPLLAPVGSM